LVPTISLLSLNWHWARLRASNLTELCQSSNLDLPKIPLKRTKSANSLTSTRSLTLAQRTIWVLAVLASDRAMASSLALTLQPLQLPPPILPSLPSLPSLLSLLSKRLVLCLRQIRRLMWTLRQSPTTRSSSKPTWPSLTKSAST
jgi:hypothetical protein